MSKPLIVKSNIIKSSIVKPGLIEPLDELNLFISYYRLLKLDQTNLYEQEGFLVYVKYYLYFVRKYNPSYELMEFNFGKSEIWRLVLLDYFNILKSKPSPFEPQTFITRDTIIGFYTRKYHCNELKKIGFSLLTLSTY